MADPAFISSDAVRNAKPLKHVRSATFPGPHRLELGGELPAITVAYEIYGELSPAKDNAILVCHALSGDSHVARHDGDDDPGWWEALVGPGRHIDTRRHCVIGANVLGGCRGTTGPGSVNPATGRPWGDDFPTVTIGDMVEVHRLLLDHLGISALKAVVGGSMGGQQAMLLAIRHPSRVRGCALLATAPRLHSLSLAFDVVARNAITQDADFKGGDYYDGPQPAHGLAIARMLGHITYLSRAAMEAKFAADRMKPRDVRTQFEKRFSVGSYLAYQGDRFVERFDANTYLRLSLAIDLFDLGATPAELAQAFAPATCRFLVVSFTSDWLFPPDQSMDLVGALVALGKSVSSCDVRSGAGHDAFLLESELPVYGGLVRGLIDRLDRDAANQGPDAGDGHLDPLGHGATNVFYSRRLDYDRVLDLIPRDASVLDLGCGNGGLMARLARRGQRRVVGVERDEGAVLTAVGRGLDVIHADLDKGLSMFSDGQFEVVVLSHTLQAVLDVERVLREMARVGRRSIVSFTNAAYRQHRRILADDGRVPDFGGGGTHRWWNTPVVRPCSIADFEDCCRAFGLKVLSRHYLDTHRGGEEVVHDANLQADLAIVELGR